MLSLEATNQTVNPSCTPLRNKIKSSSPWISRLRNLNDPSKELPRARMMTDHLEIIARMKKLRLRANSQLPARLPTRMDRRTLRHERGPLATT